jgi:carbon monoxide dehydrogenase subunit G
MISVTSEVTIRRPVEEVFDFLADFRNNPRWCPPELEARNLGEDGGVRRFEVTVKPGPRTLTSVYEVSVDGRPTRITYSGRNEMADFDGAYDLEEAEGGTRVVMSSNLSVRGPSRLLTPIMRRMTRANADRQCSLLKELLES